MKDGYSNFLSELVPAESLGLADCRDFQIVCPACREPVFKVERAPSTGAVHFLSHYRASKSDASECERRVAAITEAERSMLHQNGRQQRLSLFLAVLREEIDRIGASKTVLHYRNKFAQSEYFNECVISARNSLIKNEIKRDHWQKFVETAETVNNFDEIIHGGETTTPFALSIRRKIVYDLFLHLLTPAAKSNFIYLARHAAASSLERLRILELMESDEKNRAYEVKIILDFYKSAMIRNRSKSIIAMKSNLDPQQVERFVKRSMAEVTKNMVTILFRIDYIDVMKRRGGLNLENGDL